MTSPAQFTLWLVLLVFCASPVFSQTVWFKYEGNPVLDVGAPGSWDDKGAGIFEVFLENGIYRAWYTGSTGTQRRIGYSTSRDGIVWTKFPRPVIDLGVDGNWDYREAATGRVLLVASKYLMWYHGYDVLVHRIGYAESEDGIVWNKAYDANPILSEDPTGWDTKGVGFPFVMSDADGRFKMWYSGYSEGELMQIGYALGKDAKSWEKHPSPVLTRGDPGSWDDHSLLFPTVLYNGALYEMWYAGSRGAFTTARTGYATSPDGIHWTKDSRSPVLMPGRPGSWDDRATFARDVLVDGNLYRMWYGGLSGVGERTGLAVSPKGTEVHVSADGKYVAPGKDSVFIRVRVKDPTGLSFAAEIGSPDGHPADLIELLDDGAHGDSLLGDGLFANQWLPREERHYSVNLKLMARGKDDLRFKLDNTASFTSIGPVKLDKVEFVNDATANPGDTLVVKLLLGNHGSSAAADSISATISTANKWISDLSSDSIVYGTIGVGHSATTPGYYRFLISPNCPLDSEIPFEVQISSAGILRWRDRFVLSVLPPWWRSNWVYGFYFAVVVGIFLGLRRLEVRRLRLKQQREMEHFQLVKMKEVDQLKSRFFANISHEFRTPLTLIEGPARQILEGGTDTDPKESAGVIVKNTRRLLTLVNQLLDLSKIDSGQMNLHARETDVVEICRGIAAVFESFLKRKAIKFHIDCPEQPIIGWFDRDALEKIVTNLLSNALKFTPEDGQVTLRIACRPELVSGPVPGRGAEPSSARQVVITVSDTGIGIPVDQIDKVFDRFYQVDQSQTREYEGSGIGLALTKELIELHHGTISLQSEVGKGTTFVVSLPCLPHGDGHLNEGEVTDVPRPATQHLTPATFKPPSPALEVVEPENGESLPLVLIIEDNADMRRYIRTHLKGEYRFGEAVNGEEGVQKAIETIPDLIISDVMMPKMDGFKVCRTIKKDERTSHIPIILLTAKAAAEDKVEGLEIGADDYVTKPFDAREMLVRVKNLIEQRRMLREKFQREFVLHPANMEMQSVDAAFLKKAVGIIESHISDPMFDTPSFAHEVAMSRMQLHRKLRALTNQGPGELIRSFRMKRAASLLQHKAGNVSEIAYEVGYNNPSYFAQVFREHFGMAPSEYPARQETHQQ